MKHELKCWPEFFQAAWCGDKTFEMRRNDRGFKERDEIELREFDPRAIGEEYTGREIYAFITYLANLSPTDGISENYVVFSFREPFRTEGG